MSDYISKSALKADTHKEWDGCLVWDESGERTADEFCDLIERQPTIDAVPVVRCKECKHRASNDNDWFETLVCPCECGEYSWDPPDDFFCAKGERR